MKYIIALLLGISAHVVSSGDDYSFDSNENAAGDGTTYNGFVFTVNDGDINTFPRIRFQTALNKHDTTYCFDMIGLFESEDYPAGANTNPIYSKVDNTEINFNANQCQIDNTTITKTSFDITCAVGSNGASLLSSFQFVAQNDVFEGNSGLEYTLTLSDYALSSNTSKLIISQTLKDCSTEYSYSADSDEKNDNDASNDNEVDDSMEATQEPDNDRRRRLVDSNDDGESPDEETVASKEETDGVSSDDSGEIDVGLATFLMTGTANDICYGASNEEISKTLVDSKVVYIIKDQMIQIVFDNFDCTLKLDPFFGYDADKLADSSANTFTALMAIAFTFIVVFL